MLDPLSPARLVPDATDDLDVLPEPASKMTDEALATKPIVAGE